MSQRQDLRKRTPVAESSSRALAALVITCLLAVLVPGMVALIGYRSTMIHGPSTAVVIGGNPSVDGAKIEVTESNEPHHKLHSVIDRDGGYQSPILLDPGYYHVTVTHKGKMILNADFAPDQSNGVRFDLPSIVQIFGNKTFADARIDIVPVADTLHQTHPDSIRLGPDGRCRDGVYLLAGNYRAIARSSTGPDHVLAQVDFKVDNLEPTVVDLTKPAVTDE